MVVAIMVVKIIPSSVIIIILRIIPGSAMGEGIPGAGEPDRSDGG